MPANAIEKIEIVGSSKGLDALADDLNRVADAQENVADATKASATVTERSSRTVAATTRAYERVSQQVDAAYRSEQLYARGKAALDKAFQQQIIGATVYAQRLDQLAVKYAKIDAANDNLAGGTLRASSAFDRMRASVAQAGEHVTQAQAKITKAAAAMAQFRGLALGAAGAIGIGGSFALGDIISTTSEFQKLSGSLETVTGSAAKANAAMAFVRDFAAKTPFDVQQVTEAFIKLKLLGLDPSAAALTSYGNTASAMGKSLMQFIEAIADATTGEFERLKEFGIKASKDGENIGFTFQGQTTVVKNAAADIEQYLRRIGEVNFAGGMERQAAQLGGALSNAQDAVANFQNAIGEGGLADAVEDAARAMAEFLNQNQNLAASLGGALGDFIRDLGQIINDTGTAAAYMTGKFQEAGRGIAEVLARIAATGPASMAAFMAGWDNFPELMKAVVTAAFNSIVQAVERAINDNIDEVNRWVGFINTIRQTMGAEPIELFGHVDFEGMKREYIGGAADIAAVFADTFESEQAKTSKAIRDIFGGSEAVGDQLALKYGIQETTDAAGALGSAASAAGAAIDAGMTKPSKEAAKALREAEAAKKALFSEADAAVAEFFPMAQAEAEAARLTEMINNTSNGLSDLQRNALGMQIAKNFEDAVPAVENLRSSGTAAAADIGASFIENVGDVFADVFSQATRDGESFFGSLIKGFAGLGSQLAAAGGKNLIGQLLGITDPASKSAAGIGSIGGGSYGGLPSISSSAGVGMSFASSAPQIQALNRNLGGVGSNVLKLAKGFEGLNERSSSQLLNGFLSKSGTTQLDARTQAWCAAFANAALMENGVQGTGSNMASSFLDWGMGTNNPKAGDIVVLKPQGRGSSGHVGFVTGFGDGTVQIFGGNQSNAAKTSSYSTNQVAGYRTYADERVVAKGVSKGMTDFSRQTGYEQGAENDPWNGMRQTTGSGGMPFGQQAFGAIGAGLGIFSQGYQSGSPISGGIGGALGGFQAGSALFPALGAAGPIGAVAGAAIGIIGGIFGGRAEREKKHREQAATWADMQPQYLDWQKSVQKARPTSGLSDFFATETANFDTFRETGGAAWKYGTNNSSQDFIDVGTAMFAKFHEIRDAFRDTIDPMIEALEAGRGMDSPFADARNQLYALGDQLLQFVDDTKESLSYRPDEAYRVDEARAAALAQVDQSLDVVEPLSALAEEIERLQGGALGAKKVMQDLGRSAEEAGRVVDEKLVAALAGVGRNLEQDLRDQIADMDGKGYLADFRSLIEDNAAMMATIAANSALNVDTSLVDEFFAKSAQALVNGAELTGSAFDDLIAAFPELAGVVKSFTESVESSADAIKARALGYQDRLFAATTDTSVIGGALASFDRGAARERQDEIAAGGQAILDLEAALAAERLAIIKDFNDRAAEEAKQAADEAKDFLTNLTRSIKEFTDGLRAGAESPLAPKERLAAAQSQYDAQYALAKTGDRDAANALTGYASDLLEASKAYNASSPDYQATFSAIIAQLEALPKQVSAEQFIVDTIKDTAAAQLDATAAMQEALRTAFAAGPQATAAALSSSFSMLDTSLDGLLDYSEMRSALTGIATDAQIRTMMNVLDTNGDGQLSKLELINAATAQQNNLIGSQNSVLNAIVANTQSQHGNAVAAYGLAQNHRDISAEILRTRQLSNARGYMTGGYTGNGPTNAVAGVVHGQEGVLNAQAMRALGRPMLDAMNRGTMRMPAIAMPMMPQLANDNRGLEQRMDRVEKAVLAIGDQIARATVEGAKHVRVGVDEVSSAQQDLARDAKLKKTG